MALGLPKIDFDIGDTVREFLTVLRSMDAKLDTLIDLQRQSLSGHHLTDVTARRMAFDAGRVGADALAEHHVNDRGEVTMCPITVTGGGPRDHQVTADGQVTRCIAADMGVARCVFCHRPGGECVANPCEGRAKSRRERRR